MDAVCEMVLLCLAALIVQRHHSHPTYEHMMDDDEEFHLKLLVFDIVVILYLVLVIVLFILGLLHHPSGVLQFLHCRIHCSKLLCPLFIDSAILIDVLIILWHSVSTIKKVLSLSSDGDALSLLY